MSELLFDNLPVTESPRLKWLRAHNVQTRKNPRIPDDEFPWEAVDNELSLFRESHGIGATEHDALVDLAIKRKWRMWNET
jgi:hypothetical protein